MQKKPPRRRDSGPARVGGPDRPRSSGPDRPRGGGGERSRGGRSPGGPPTDKIGIKNPYLRYRPLKKPQIALHPTTLWDYPSQHYGKNEQGSQGYRGATPSHIIWNVVARYTKEGDLVVDPFVGSGTTLDVCRDLGRRAKGFDLAPTRTDIVRGDARDLSHLVERESAHLVFFDPPYADNLKYSDDPACIGKLPYRLWHTAMGQVLDEIMAITRPGGTVCGFVSDVLHVEHKRSKQGGREHKSLEKEFQPLGVALWNLAVERGFVPVDHVAVVRRGKALDDPRLRARAEEDHFMLRGFSHLVIFQRPATALAKKASSSSSSAAAAAASGRSGRGDDGAAAPATRGPPPSRASRRR
jgi:DNA modification methylase